MIHASLISEFRGKSFVLLLSFHSLLLRLFRDLIVSYY